MLRHHLLLTTALVALPWTSTLSIGNDDEGGGGSGDPGPTVRESLNAAATELSPAPEAPLAAPEHWELGDREFFTKADRATQSYLLDRDKRYMTGFNKTKEEYDGYKKRFDPVAELFKPYADVMKQHNLTEATIVQRYLAAEQALRTKPLESLLHLAKRYNVTPQQLAEALKGAAPANPEAELDPNDPIVKLIKPLQEQVGQLTEAQKREAANQRARETAQLQAAVVSFETEKGADGQPAYPHAQHPEVRRLMGVLIKSGEVDIAKAGGIGPALKIAYQKAVHATDETREALLQSAQKAQAEAAKKAEAAKVAAARRAGSSISGASSSGAEPAPRKGGSSVRASLREAAEQIGYGG